MTQQKKRGATYVMRIIKSRPKVSYYTVSNHIGLFGIEIADSPIVTTFPVMIATLSVRRYFHTANAC